MPLTCARWDPFVAMVMCSFSRRWIRAAASVCQERGPTTKPKLSCTSATSPGRQRRRVEAGPIHVEVNDTRLRFDVDGPALVPSGAAMEPRPTVVLVHGGPGTYDHSYFKPDFAKLTRFAQV